VPYIEIAPHSAQYPGVLFFDYVKQEQREYSSLNDFAKSIR